MKVCAEPGCPELVTTGRCQVHTRQRDRARGSRQVRGYDSAHDQLRAGIARQMAVGTVFTCWRCERVVYPHAFDLGHCDDDRTIYHGVEHPACNRSARGDCPHPSHAVISPDAYRGGEVPLPAPE